jgi:hypothetical protein
MRVLASAALALPPLLACAQGIPPAQEVGVMLRPEARVVRSLPAGRALRLALSPLPREAIDPLPGGRPLALTLTPLAPARIALPAGRVLLLQLAAETGTADPETSANGPVDPAALAAIASASFPVAQPLSVTLVPPTAPLAAVANANFPPAQPLSVTLVPPATPLTAIANASFPVAQPLSVTLYAGEALTAPTLIAGIAPTFTVAAPQYTVQIVQVIPRRGANFFDRLDPTGQRTLVAQAGGAPTAGGGGGGSGPACTPPATPPLSAEICGTTLSLSDDGFPFGANLGPQGNRSMHLTPVGGAQIQLAAQTGITPNAACPALLCMATQVFTPGPACDGLAFVDTGTPKTAVVKFRRNGGQVCAQRLQ